MIAEKILRKLYCDQKLSMVEVANKLCTTPHVVEYWLEKYGISRRSWSESAYVKQNPNGDPFTIKRNLSQKDKELLIAGLMLFLGEGNRRDKYSIQLGNLNPIVIQIFTKFLRQIYKINENKFKLLVRLHKKFDKNKARIFWSKILKMPKRRVLIYTHNDPRSKDEQQRSEYGIATLMFCNMKLKKWLNDSLNKYIQKLLK